MAAFTDFVLFVASLCEAAAAIARFEVPPLLDIFFIYISLQYLLQYSACMEKGSTLFVEMGAN